MKLLNAVLVFSLATTALCAKQPLDEKEVVNYAKKLDIAKLDPSLASEPLEAWLRFGPAHIEKIQWSMSRDCDLKPAAGEKPQADWPLCVRFGFQGSGIGGWAMMKVGTLGKGVSGEPHFEYFVVSTGGAKPVARNSTKLSELPRLMNELTSLTRHR